MPHEYRSTLGIYSRVLANGTLELSLKAVPIPEPGPDEVVVRIEAAPLHPADIGLLLGPADLSTARKSGSGETSKVEIEIPAQRMGSLAPRMDQFLPVGNEGSGVVVAAGAHYQDLIGNAVAVMGGAMITRYRVLGANDFLPIPRGLPLEKGAAALINPLTALAMLETMRAEGHSALVHTAAASSLGQMLNRICLKDNIPLVNIVRRKDQAEILIGQGARHVCDSSSPTFIDDLNAQIAETGATLAFDALGGGRLAGQILSAMERACLATSTVYNRYGSKVHKQVYLYGGLDTSMTELDRSYGMCWSVGGWLIFDELLQMKLERRDALRARIASEIDTTFACDFAGELSMTELMDVSNLEVISRRGTGTKFLVNPARELV